MLKPDIIRNKEMLALIEGVFNNKNKICPNLSPPKGKIYYQGSNLALYFHALEYTYQFQPVPSTFIMHTAQTE